MKISLAINSKKPIKDWLDDCLMSAVVFDEIVLYLDGPLMENIPEFKVPVSVIHDGQERSIIDGFNLAIRVTSGDWVCSFCDDDYFLQPALSNLLIAIKEHEFGNDADIIHFPVSVNGQYSWGHRGDFTLHQILVENLIPHGSFIRRSAFDKLEGYRIDEGADWNLWIRAKKAGLIFKYFPEDVYFFRHGHDRSAFNKQVGAMGGFQNLKDKVLANA